MLVLLLGVLLVLGRRHVFGLAIQVARAGVLLVAAGIGSPEPQARASGHHLLQMPDPLRDEFMDEDLLTQNLAEATCPCSARTGDFAPYHEGGLAARML